MVGLAPRDLEDKVRASDDDMKHFFENDISPEGGKDL
jgi:hypothetical protein